MSIGERLRASRRAKGLTQREAAEKLGVSQAMIDKLERDLTVRSKHLLPYAQLLDIPSVDVESYIGGVRTVYQAKMTAPTPLHSFGSQATTIEIPLYATTEQETGRMAVEDEPYSALRSGFPESTRGTYGLLIGSEAMAPVFRARDVAIVQPHLPPRAGSRVAILNHQTQGRVAILAEFAGQTAEVWRVRLSASSHKESELAKSDWRICHCVSAVIFGT